MLRSALLLLTLAGSASAQTLVLRETWDWAAPELLAWDPVVCGLWIAAAGPHATLVAPDGTPRARIEGDLTDIQALTLGPEGLLIVDNSGRAQWLDRDGTALSDVFRLPLPDAEGIEAMPDGSYLAIQDDPEALTRLTPRSDGSYMASTLDTSRFTPPLWEPQGIALDPGTGNLLIVDDQDGANRLYEVTQDGAVLGDVDLSGYGRDPEGIALHPGTGTLWIAFDNGNRIVVFDYLSGTGALPGPDACAPPMS